MITPSPNVLGGTRPLCKITNCRSNALSMNIQTVNTYERSNLNEGRHEDMIIIAVIHATRSCEIKA